MPKTKKKSTNEKARDKRVYNRKFKRDNTPKPEPEVIDTLPVKTNREYMRTKRLDKNYRLKEQTGKEFRTSDDTTEPSKVHKKIIQRRKKIKMLKE